MGQSQIDPVPGHMGIGLEDADEPLGRLAETLESQVQAGQQPADVQVGWIDRQKGAAQPRQGGRVGLRPLAASA